MRKLGVITAAAALVAVMGFGGAAWAATLWVDDDGTFDSTNSTCDDTGGGDTATFTDIQSAIDAASDGDVIKICPGTYTDDLSITTDNLTLMGVDMTTSIIEGVAVDTDTELGVASGATGFPTATPNIDIQADGVRITTLTINSPELADTGNADTGEYSSGMILSGEDIRIDHNYFLVSSGLPGSVAIQTWSGLLPAFSSNSIDGLSIDHNSFANLGAGFVGFGYEGVFINPQGDTIDADVNVADNTFSGNLYRGVGVARDETNVLQNEMCTDISGPQATVDFGGAVPWGVRVFGNEDVWVHENVIGADCTSSGNFGVGIDFSFGVTDSAAKENNIDHAGIGIHLDDSSGGNEVLNNSIGHSLEDGIFIESDSNTVNRNTPHHSGDDGIQVDGDDNSFEGNNSHHNDDCAYEDNGTDNTFSTSRSTRNKAKFNGDNDIPGTTCS